MSRSRWWGRRMIVLLAGALSVTLPMAPATATTANPQDSLVEQVAAAAEAQAAGGEWVDTNVQVLRTETGRWAFGTVVLVAPQREGAYPLDWLFVAERQQNSWRVGLDGQLAFAELSARAPVLSAEEKTTFAKHDGQARPMIAGDYRTGMRLPWAVGQAWTIRGGPHAYDAGSGPWSSVDLVGGDQRVLAARQGLAYTPCVGLIRIVHPDGYATRYYHLWNHIQANGTSVAAGTFLGNTGTEIGCGGAASSRHVHFSLQYNGSFIGIANHIIGKWLFRNGSSQYSGSALHGSVSVPVGGTITNYGALGWTQGIVDANGGGTVNRRNGPGTGYSVVGTVADGATISIACSANGTSHTGRWGTTSLWNKLTDGTWVSDAFVYTGVDGPVNGYC